MVIIVVSLEDADLITGLSDSEPQIPPSWSDELKSIDLKKQLPQSNYFKMLDGGMIIIDIPQESIRQNILPSDDGHETKEQLKLECLKEFALANGVLSLETINSTELEDEHNLQQIIEEIEENTEIKSSEQQVLEKKTPGLTMLRMQLRLWLSQKMQNLLYTTTPPSPATKPTRKLKLFTKKPSKMDLLTQISSIETLLKELEKIKRDQPISAKNTRAIEIITSQCDNKLLKSSEELTKFICDFKKTVKETKQTGKQSRDRYSSFT